MKLAAGIDDVKREAVLRVSLSDHPRTATRSGSARCSDLGVDGFMPVLRVLPL